MDRNQMVATGVFFAMIAIIFLGFMTVGAAVPERVGELYPVQSDTRLTTGRLRTYISDKGPEDTYQELYRKLGRPEDTSSLSKWRDDRTQPILMLYDDYVITISSMENGQRSKVEVAGHETAYNRHRSSFIYYRGSYWGPSLRRGSVYRGGGTGKVQSGGIGGLGGK